MSLGTHGDVARYFPLWSYMKAMEGVLINMNGFSDPLTHKQAEALELVGEHMSSKEIALLLRVSPHSVDKRLDEARSRLGAGTRKQAYRIYRAMKDGFGTGESLTGEPFTVPKLPKSKQVPSNERAEALYTFDDVGIYSRPSKWSIRAGVPELKPAQLGPSARVGLILAGALGLVVLAVLLLSFAQGLEAMLY